MSTFFVVGIVLLFLIAFISSVAILQKHVATDTSDDEIIKELNKIDDDFRN